MDGDEKPSVTHPDIVAPISDFVTLFNQAVDAIMLRVVKLRLEL